MHIVRNGKMSTALGDTRRNIDYRRKGIANKNLEIETGEV